MKTSLPVALALVVGLVIGLVIGLVTGWFGGGGVRDTGGVPTRHAHAEAEHEVAGGVRATEVELAAASDDVRRATTDAESGVSAHAIAAARERAPEPPSAAQATGSITGFVRDPDGAPVAGVEVRATAGQPRTSNVIDSATLYTGLTAPATLDAALDRAAQRWAESRGREARTQTAEDGSYTLPAVGGGDSTSVDAGLAGWAVTALGRNSELESGARLDFVARRAARLHVDVVDANGVALAEAVLQWKATDNSRYIAWRRGTPLFVAPDAGQLRAHLDYVGNDNQSRPDSRAASPFVALVLAAGDEQEVRLVVEPRVRVEGRILEADGRLCTRFSSVVAAPITEAATGDDFGAVVESTAARRSRFVLHDLAPGRWNFGVELPDYTITARVTVDIAVGTNTFDIVVPANDPERTLTVRVVGPDGLPARSQSIEAEWSGGERDSVGHSTDTVGVVTVDLVELSDGAEEPWSVLTDLRIRASTSDRRAGVVSVPPDSREVTVVLEEPGRVVVTAEGLDDSSLAAVVSVRINRLRGYDPSEPTKFSGASWRSESPQRAGNTWTYERIETGYHEVQLVVPRDVNRRGSLAAIAGRVVEVTSAGVDVVIAVPTFHEVRVVAAGLEVGTSMWLTRVDATPLLTSNGLGRGAAETDERGIAVFTDVAVGRYALTCQASEGQLEIDVPCGDVVFDLPTWNAWRVVVTSTEGKLHRAGLRDGDLVIGFVGSDTRLLSAWMKILSAADGAVPVAIVERGDQRLEIELGPLAHENWWFEGMGGQLLQTIDR